MKKHLLLAAMATVAISAMADAPADLITTMPQGTLYSNCYTYSDLAMYIYGGALGASNTDARRGDIIVNEDTKEIFIHNIVGDYPGIDSWVKGTLGDDGVATFSFPQPVFYRAAQGNAAELTVYATMVTPVQNGTAVDLVPDTQNPSLRMTWDGKALTQIKPGTVSESFARYDGLIGLLNQNNGFTGYGEAGLSYTVWADAPVAIPAGADVEEMPYTLTYNDAWNDPFTIRSTFYHEVGTDTYYISGLNREEPTQLVKATIADGKLTIPSGQFMGYTAGYFTFFYGGTAGRDSHQAPVYTWVDNASFDAEADTFTATTDMIINLGNRKPTLGFGINGAKFTSIDAQVLTPAAPVVDDSSTEVIEDEGLTLFILCFTQEPVSNDGQALETSKLFYTVYINDEPYTFDPDMALGTLEAPMTEVPWEFDNGDDIGLLSDGYHVTAGFTFDEVKTLGVQSFYKNRDGETRTEIVYWKDPAGVEDITAAGAAVVATSYYDLSGRSIDTPAGLCIRRDILADGSVKASKVFVR